MKMQLELLFEPDKQMWPHDKSKQNRSLKIQQGPYRNGRPSYPMLRLHGKWLAKAGFTSGSMVIVKVEEGQLIIKLIKV